MIEDAGPPQVRVAVRANRPLVVLYLLGAIGLPLGIVLSSVSNSIVSAAYAAPMADGITLGAASFLSVIAGPLAQLGLLALAAAIAVHAVLWHSVQRDERSRRIIG